MGQVLRTRSRELATVEKVLNLTGDLLQCPYCRHDLQIPDSVWFYYCDNCHENLDLKAQFAYQRGLEAFDEGQELMVDKGPRKPRRRQVRRARSV